MKTIQLFTVGLLLTITSSAWAHGPKWVNHQSDVRYYFLPEINTYYDAYENVYIFNEYGNQWVHHENLPHHLNRHFTPNEVVIIHNYYGPQPYLFHAESCRPKREVVVYHNRYERPHRHYRNNYNRRYCR
jgi:hypothetical protein